MKNIIFLLFFIAIISACIDKPKVIDPIYDNALNQTQLEMAKKAYAVFCDVCKPLMSQYTDDIESIKIEKRDVRVKGYGCMDYRCRDYGWDFEYEMQVKIKDDTSVIPGEFRAWGHTLYFFLGGPQNPGITISKIPELCGRERVTSKDVYISEPRLSLINN